MSPVDLMVTALMYLYCFGGYQLLCFEIMQVVVSQGVWPIRSIHNPVGNVSKIMREVSSLENLLLCYNQDIQSPDVFGITEYVTYVSKL